MADHEPLIVTVIRSYHPDWIVPRDNGNEWLSCLCPFHGDGRPSAAVSFVNNAFACFACDAKGDAIGIIMREEGIRYPEAVRHAEELSPGVGDTLRQEPARKPRRRTFGGAWATEEQGGAVPPGVRERPTPWS